MQDSENLWRCLKLIRISFNRNFIIETIEKILATHNKSFILDYKIDSLNHSNDHPQKFNN
jgi:hypothetical protein